VNTLAEYAKTSQIVGLYYNKTDGYCSQLKLGQMVELRAEPSNQYDPNAIGVYYGTMKLGYIPITDALHFKKIWANYQNHTATFLSYSPKNYNATSFCIIQVKMW
jgi:hypothetical protein